jgi:hypothetical protein
MNKRILATIGVGIAAAGYFYLNHEDVKPKTLSERVEIPTVEKKPERISRRRIIEPKVEYKKSPKQEKKKVEEVNKGVYDLRRGLAEKLIQEKKNESNEEIQLALEDSNYGDAYDWLKELRKYFSEDESEFLDSILIDNIIIDYQVYLLTVIDEQCKNRQPDGVYWNVWNMGFMISHEKISGELYQQLKNDGELALQLCGYEFYD